MKNPKRPGGYSMVELLVAVFLALLVVLALGRIILANQRTWGWGRDKAMLQANLTEAIESIGRSVRAADSLVVISAAEFHTYLDGSVVHRYKRMPIGSEARLQKNGVHLVDRNCTQFSVTGDSEGRSVAVRLELADRSGNLISGMTRATIRARSFEF